MTTSKHISSVVLFPLCDPSNILMDALLDTSGSTATRGDALVFAWRLGLGSGVNIGHSANAVLLTVFNVPRDKWSRSQLLIIRELMVLAGREESPTKSITARADGYKVSESISQQRNTPVGRKVRERRSTPRHSAADKSVVKKDKNWWKLVGADESINPTTPAR